MTSDREIEGYARECVRLAQQTDDPKIREQLLQMAREWMALAMHEEKASEPKSPVSR
jgi:hypothetical protein